MARKPTGIIRTARVAEVEFNEQAFVEGVFNDEYILVVGSGVILDRQQFPDSHGDINQHIINEINHDRRAARVGFIDHKNFTEVFRGTARDEIDPIYQLLAKGYEFSLNEISPELTQLLRTKLFKFVLTTTIDGYLEALMKDIWGEEELRIVNIEDSQSVQDFQTALKNSRINKYTQPTLFYVFGKVVKNKLKPRDYVETDEDAIQIIEKWVKLDSGENIVPFLKSKSMLAIGCKFDDWYFRFFWHIITQRFGTDDGRPLDNLAAVFEDSRSDQQLKEYLHRVDVCMHEEVWEFMQHIHTLFTSTSHDSPFRQLVLDKRRTGGIFISYKSSDLLAASEIFFKLTKEERLKNVWFDNANLHGGDQYTPVIKDAIRRAKIFIPILSPAIAGELKTHGEHISTYYSNEWRWASENKNIIVIPVAIGGYNLRGEEHQFFERIIAQQLTGIDMTEKPSDMRSPEKVGFAKLIGDIYNHLGIEE